MSLQRLIPWLGALLVAQVLLALMLWVGGTSAPATRAKLLDFNRAAVDHIEISDGKHELVIARSGDHWILPGLYDFPAATFRVDGLLDDLASLKPGLALATSDEAAKRFRVGDEGFERRVRLKAGDKVLATLYLGDAAGPRRAYGRAGGDNAIYTLTFTAAQADAEDKAWTDKTVLQHPVADVKALKLGDIELTRDGDQWQLAGLADGQVTDQEAAAALVQRIASLTFMGVHGRADQTPAGKELLAVDLTLDGGKSLHYRFIDPGQGGDPLLLASGLDHVLRIASFEFKPIQETTRDSLVKAAPAKPADDQANPEAVVPAPTPTPTEAPAPAG